MLEERYRFVNSSPRESYARSNAFSSSTFSLPRIFAECDSGGHRFCLGESSQSLQYPTLENSKAFAVVASFGYVADRPQHLCEPTGPQFLFYRFDMIHCGLVDEFSQSRQAFEPAT